MRRWTPGLRAQVARRTDAVAWCSVGRIWYAPWNKVARLKEPVPAEGPIVSEIRGAACLNARVAREVDAGSCEQSGVRQSVAGIAVAEKNRCLRISAPGAWSVAVRHRSSGLAGTISGTIEGTVGGRVSRDLVYT